MSGIKIEGGDLGSLLAGIMQAKGGGGDVSSVKPARIDQIRDLLEKPVKFAVGDIVSLKDNSSRQYRFPRPGEKCIVTQSLDTPYRSGEHGSHAPAVINDIALAFFDDEVGEDGTAFESLYDSRHFVKVGSIYDPIKLDNGETLPVE